MTANYLSWRDDAKNPYAGFIVIGIAMIAVGITLITVSHAFISFIGAGAVFICIGIAKSRESGSSGDKDDTSE